MCSRKWLVSIYFVRGRTAARDATWARGAVTRGGPPHGPPSWSLTEPRAGCETVKPYLGDTCVWPTATMCSILVKRPNSPSGGLLRRTNNVPVREPEGTAWPSSGGGGRRIRSKRRRRRAACLPLMSLGTAGGPGLHSLGTTSEVVRSASTPFRSFHSMKKVWLQERKVAAQGAWREVRWDKKGCSGTTTDLEAHEAVEAKGRGLLGDGEQRALVQHLHPLEAGRCEAPLGALPLGLNGLVAQNCRFVSTDERERQRPLTGRNVAVLLVSRLGGAVGEESLEQGHGVAASKCVHHLTSWVIVATHSLSLSLPRAPVISPGSRPGEYQSRTGLLRSW